MFFHSVVEAELVKGNDRSLMKFALRLHSSPSNITQGRHSA
jgi:hypothetical protein